MGRGVPAFKVKIERKVRGRGAMGLSKKHPLEIFRSIGKDSAEKPRSLARRPARGRKSLPGKNLSGKSRTRGGRTLRPSGEDARLDNGTEGNGRRSPGDFTVTLTLNQVLLSFLVAAVLVLGGYFAGYFRAASGMEGTRLEAEMGRKEGTLPLKEPGKVPYAAEKTHPGSSRAGERAAAFSPRSAQRRYGALVATYDETREDIVDRTIKLIAERGFEKENISKVLYKKDKKYAILIGSYDRMDHPDLKRLLEKVRSIRDFPGSEKSPFRSAYIVKFPVAIN